MSNCHSALPPHAPLPPYRSMSTLAAFSQASLTPSGPVAPILNLFNMGPMGAMARSPPTDNTVSLTNYYSFKDRLERGESRVSI